MPRSLIFFSLCLLFLRQGGKPLLLRKRQVVSAFSCQSNEPSSPFLCSGRKMVTFFMEEQIAEFSSISSPRAKSEIFFPAPRNKVFPGSHVFSVSVKGVFFQEKGTSFFFHSPCPPGRSVPPFFPSPHRWDAPPLPQKVTKEEQ